MFMSRVYRSISVFSSRLGRLFSSKTIWRRDNRMLDNDKLGTSTYRKILQLRPAQSVSTQKLIEFVSERFLTDEPLTVSLKSKPENFRKMFHEWIERCLSINASFVCLDHSDQIIACSVCTMHDMEKGASMMDYSSKTCQSTKWSDDVVKVNRFFDALTSDLNHSMPECKFALELVFAAVRPEYKRWGIASHLAYMSMDAGRKLGCQYCFAVATALASQRALQNMGFKTAKIIKHEHYLDKDGKQIFVCEDNTDCGNAMFYKL